VVAVFSGKGYVRDQMNDLVEAFPKSFFIGPTCSPATASLCKGANVACLFVNDDGSKEVIEIFKKEGIKMIAMRCAGFDRLDLKACAEAGIKVARVPAYSPYAVAEHAVSLCMTLNRHIHHCYNRVREGNFDLSGLVGMEMYGKTCGIVGTGKIGYIAAQGFKGFGMRVVGYDPYPNDMFKKDIGEYVTLDELWAQADVISVHVPLLPHTRYIINKESIDKMKDGAMVINVSRGGLVDTKALIEACMSGKLTGAGLDVYEREDELFFKDFSIMPNKMRMEQWDNDFALLRALPNVLLTPHSAFLTNEALKNICNTTILNCEEFGQQKPLTNEVKA
jgi:D-lactate dehydrogenase